MIYVIEIVKDIILINNVPYSGTFFNEEGEETSYENAVSFYVNIDGQHISGPYLTVMVH